ncbi:MAG: BatD family protein [Candidatus Omnitrophica bacterium]|nr:BatD family protein [Candidatus Omnitrophota bacterium]
MNKGEAVTGEIFTYTVIVEGELHSPQVTIPEFGPLKVAGQSSSRSYRVRNGRRRVQMEFVYHLVAYEPGEYTLDGVEVKDGQKVFRSDKVTVKVTGEPIDIDKERELEKFRGGAISL